MTTEYILHMDKLGRITIPSYIRNKVGAADGGDFSVMVTNGGIMLRPAGTECGHCGGQVNGGIRHKGVPLCPLCVAEIKAW